MYNQNFRIWSFGLPTKKKKKHITLYIIYYYIILLLYLSFIIFICIAHLCLYLYPIPIHIPIHYKTLQYVTIPYNRLQ